MKTDADFYLYLAGHFCASASKLRHKLSQRYIALSNQLRIGGPSVQKKKDVIEGALGALEMCMDDFDKAFGFNVGDIPYGLE